MSYVYEEFKKEGKQSVKRKRPAADTVITTIWNTTITSTSTSSRQQTDPPIFKLRKKKPKKTGGIKPLEDKIYEAYQSQLKPSQNPTTNLLFIVNEFDKKYNLKRGGKPIDEIPLTRLFKKVFGKLKTKIDLPPEVPEGFRKYCRKHLTACIKTE